MAIVMTRTLSSPCIGICSTVYGDNICRGCKRNYREVIDWNRYDEQEKQQIYQRLQQQIEQVVATFIDVIDPAQLKTKLQQANGQQPLLYDSPLFWAYELLRLQAVHITTLADYGLQATADYQALSTKALFTLLDDELYALANGKSS